MKLANILLEGWKPQVKIINGEKTVSKFTGESDNLQDFLKAIDRLPDSIESIKVPINTALQVTDKDSKVITPSGEWKQEVKQSVINLVKQYEQEGQVVDKFNLNTFGLITKPTDKFYIQLWTSRSSEFSKAMSSGEYGSLD